MNYISAAVYVLIALSMAIGIKIARPRQFNEDAFSMDAMTCLKGVMALFVLFHHLSQKKLFQETHTISVFEHIGFVFVGVFFFCSGYGLYKSFITKENYLKSFLKRRILPIVISYYVMIAIYAVYHIISGSSFTPVEWIFKLSGLVLINTQGWYVPVIILMYLSFYFIFKSDKLRKHGIPILIGITLFQGLLFCVLNHFPWYLGDHIGWWMEEGALANLPWWRGFCALPFEGEWWVNSTIGFTLGIAVAKHEKSFIERFSKSLKARIIIFILFVLTTCIGLGCLWNVGYWTEFSGELGFTKKLICYFAQCLQVIFTDLFIVLLMRKVYVHNRLYTFFGKRTLEMYLMQEIALFGWLPLIELDRKPIFKPYNWNVIAYMAVVLATVTVSAVIYNLINRALTKKLKA